MSFRINGFNISLLHELCQGVADVADAYMAFSSDLLGSSGFVERFKDGKTPFTALEEADNMIILSHKKGLVINVYLDSHH